MSWLSENVFGPVQTLFQAPKRLFRTGTKYGQSNWIADLFVPMVLGAAGPAGPFLSAAYGAARRGAITNWDPGQMAWGGLQGYGAGGVGGALGAASKAPASVGSSVLNKIGWGAKQYWGATTAPFGMGQTANVGANITGGGIPGVNAPSPYTSNLPISPQNMPWGYSYPSSSIPPWGISGISAIKSAGETGAVAPFGGMEKLVPYAAGAASLLATPPEVSYMETGEKLAKARQTVMAKYLGEEAAARLPSAVAENYLDMITKPIGELYPIEKDARWGRQEKTINRSYDEYEESINASFAQAGGIGSEDHRRTLAEATRMRAEELSQSRNEMEQQLFETQIKMKQDALMGAAEQGRFDETLAMELARMVGEEDALRVSLETQDYDTFQRVMGLVMAMGLQNTIPSLSEMRGA